MEKLRKSVDEDEAKLMEEQEQVRLLEEAVDRAKLDVALCQEHSFVELVVKLVKYKAQRDEMLRIYAKGMAEYKWIEAELDKHNDETVADTAMEESAPIIDETVADTAVEESGSIIDGVVADNAAEESGSIIDGVVADNAAEESPSIIDESFDSVSDQQEVCVTTAIKAQDDVNTSFMDFGSVVISASSLARQTRQTRASLIISSRPSIPALPMWLLPILLMLRQSRPISHSRRLRPVLHSLLSDALSM